MNKPMYTAVQYNNLKRNDIIMFDNGNEATVLTCTPAHSNKTTIEFQYTDVYLGNGKTTTYSATLIKRRS